MMTMKKKRARVIGSSSFSLYIDLDVERVMAARLGKAIQPASMTASGSRLGCCLASETNALRSSLRRQNSKARRTSSRCFSLIHTPIEDTQARIAKVPNRSIIAIEGRDTIKLLQGLITNNIKELHRDQTMYCAFLNPQGRMLSSAFIFSSKDDCALVDLDSNACAGLLAFIKRFKLRSKVTLKDVSEEYQVWATWGKGAQIQSGSSSILASGHDNRSPLMGHRLITSKDINESNLTSSSDSIDTPESYTIHRILQGVPDGSNDIWENQSLPLEANADFMNAVDFRKGCYVGQELTARTHHTGVVRKRVIPISFYTSTSSPPDTFQVDTNVSITLPEKGAEVRSTPLNDKAARGKSTGKYLSGVHNIGLALLRLDQVHRWNKDLSIKVKTADDTTLSIRPWIPSWWPKEAQEPLE